MHCLIFKIERESIKRNNFISIILFKVPPKHNENIEVIKVPPKDNENI